MEKCKTRSTIIDWKRRVDAYNRTTSQAWRTFFPWALVLNVSTIAYDLRAAAYVLDRNKSLLLFIVRHSSGVSLVQFDGDRRHRRDVVRVFVIINLI